MIIIVVIVYRNPQKIELEELFSTFSEGIYFLSWGFKMMTYTLVI